MSRRDTIIVAILVNAGLLMILFATAMRSDRKESADQVTEIAMQDKKPLHEEVIDQYLSVPTVLSHSEELILSATENPFPVPPPPEKINDVQADSSSSFEIIVKKGDVLDKLAKENNTTVASLMQINNLASTQLKVGQVLRVPISKVGRPSEPMREVKEHPKEAAKDQGEYYVIREGDNPWLIATKNHLKLEDLLRLNSLDEQKARRLRPGDRLKIR